MRYLLATALFLSLPAYAADNAIDAEHGLSPEEYRSTGYLAQMCGIDTRPPTIAHERQLSTLELMIKVGQAAYVTGMGVGYCRGMVIGVSALASANAELSRDWPLKACPGNMNTKEIILRFRTWAAKNRAQ